jgi:hypothetical protein
MQKVPSGLSSLVGSEFALAHVELLNDDKSPPILTEEGDVLARPLSAEKALYRYCPRTQKVVFYGKKHYLLTLVELDEANRWVGMFAGVFRGEPIAKRGKSINNDLSFIISEIIVTIRKFIRGTA